MDRIVKEFKGYSKSRIYLMDGKSGLFVRKIGNIDRNYNKLIELKELGFNVPKVYRKGRDSFDMEYIHGVGVAEFLQREGPYLLVDFLTDFLEKISLHSVDKDYTDVYWDKLKQINFKSFDFSKDELISRLPKTLYRSIYHGDLTLENIIFSNGEFYLIDCSTSDYDSWVFDIAKLRQDLECKWFLRNKDGVGLYSYLRIVQDQILKAHPIGYENSLLILMLLRILPYSRERQDIETEEFLIKNINKQWLL